MQFPDAESLGRKRFPDNRSFRKDLRRVSLDIQSVMQDLQPSNYALSTNTNISKFYRTIAREFGRLSYDIDALSDDKVYTNTRIRFLQQILGERLWLFERIAPPQADDESFRDYLISIKNAYLIGSKKDNIESIASKFTGLDVHLRELYLESRNPASSYDVHDTHKMIVDVLVDHLPPHRNLTQLINDLDFFVNLIRPAHVLYDTNLIWTEILDINKAIDMYFGDTGGGCIPVYDYKPITEPSVLALHIRVTDDPSEADSKIGSIQNDAYVLYLTDGTKAILEPGEEGTGIYNARGRRITIDGLRIGDYIKLTSLEIPGDFQFWYKTPGLITNGNAQYYRSIYRRPAFQEYVKKVMDSKGRFPLQIKSSPTTLCDRWVQDLLNPLYEDLRKNCQSGADSSTSYTVTIAEHMGSPRLSLPWPPEEINDDFLSGSSYSYRMSKTPLTDGSGGSAVPSDIHVAYDTTNLFGAVEWLDSSSGKVLLTDSTSFWDSSVGHAPLYGDTLDFNYTYSLDGTDTTYSESHIFGLSYWQMPNQPIINGDNSGTLANTDDVNVWIDGTQVTDSISSILPLFGQIQLKSLTSYWNSSELGRTPDIGDTIKFEYNYGSNYIYPMIMDDVERLSDTWINNWSYGVVWDGFDSTATNSGMSLTDPTTIGYRYRTYHLHHTSVLNSPDTLLLNNYQKPANRASLINQQDSVNHDNLFFSGEFLNDTSSIIELNDEYLENGLDPILKLHSGTPPFQKTYGYQPGLIYHRKLKDIREHRHPLMYSDLLLKEFVEQGDNVSLSSICDNDAPAFKIRFTEEIPDIKECDQWILFDTVETTETELHIPGEKEAVPNLRVPGKKLRDNFVLREIGDVGIIPVTYSFETPSDSTQVVFWLPETQELSVPEHGLIDFPSLPIMKNSSVLAGPGDIGVSIDGTTIFGAVSSLDPLTGRIELSALSPVPKTEDFTLITSEIAAAEVTLDGYPDDPDAVAMSVNGTPKINGVDFWVINRTVYWTGGPLDGVLVVGDVLEFAYDENILIDSTVEFSYNILNTQDVDLIDESRSRIMDNDYVFGGSCPDPIQVDPNISFEEYINFLSDYSDDIRIKYYNRTTMQIEEHVFSGPLFEIYEPSEDELSPPEAFPDALVRIKNPIHRNELATVPSYDFFNDSIVRFQKKTFKELLPDRSFRTINIIEMAPV